jgi:alpha-N-acetylglucosamine transferase
MNPYDCYKNHHKIFEKDSYSEDYAYVYLLMKSTDLFEKYLVGTLVSAFALRNQGVKNKIVIMLTKDIEEKYYKIIRKVFDKIYVVDYFLPDDKFMKGILFDRWKYLYTKINLFKLTQYKKIVFINANLLPIKNCDYLFNYDAPAAALVESRFIKLSLENKNREDDFIQSNKMLCKHDTVKELIKIDKYKNLLEYKNNEYFLMGSLLILEPNMKTYKEIKNILKGKNKKYEKLWFIHDEEFFTHYFRNKWTLIDQRFNSFLVSKKYPYLEHIFILNYQMGKPFLLNKKNKFNNYPEFKLWEKYKNILCNEFPSIKKFIDNL